MYTKAVRDFMMWKYKHAMKLATSKYNPHNLCSNLASYRIHTSGLPT